MTATSDDEELFERVRGAVAHIGNEPAPPRRASRHRRPRRVPRSVALAACAATVAIVAIAVTVVVDSDDPASAITPGLLRFEPIDATVTDLAAQATESARSQPDTTTDGVFYTLSEAWDFDIVVGETRLPDSVTLRASVEEIWVEPSGRADIAVWPTEPLEPGQVTDAFVPPPLTGEPESERSIGDFGTDTPNRIPDDPDAVVSLDVLGIGDDGSGGALLFEVIADLLARAPLTANQRAALWNTLPTVDGLAVLGQTTDRAGRPGIAIAAETTATGSLVRWIFIFDPTTATPLALEAVQLTNPPGLDLPTPVLISYRTLITATTVDAVGERP